MLNRHSLRNRNDFFPITLFYFKRLRALVCRTFVAMFVDREESATLKILKTSA